MPVIETYAPGTFCWADLGTPDAAAAKRFYTALFGWTAEDRPMGPDAFYTMFTLDGARSPRSTSRSRRTGAAAVAVLHLGGERERVARRERRSLAGPSSWSRSTCSTWDAWRWCRIPTGAVVALWEPRRHAGAGVAGETELDLLERARDDRHGDAPARSTPRCSAGRPRRSRMGPGTYTMFTRGGAPRGGMMAIAPALRARAAALAGLLRGERLRRQHRPRPVARRGGTGSADRHPRRRPVRHARRSRRARSSP